MSKEYDVGRKYHEFGVSNESRTSDESPRRVGKTARDKQSGAWGNRFANRPLRIGGASSSKSGKKR